MRWILYDMLFPSRQARRHVNPEHLSSNLRDKLAVKTAAARTREQWLTRLRQALSNDIDETMSEFVEKARVRREADKK